MKDKLKIQIIGWLLLIISLLVTGSMIGYDLTEEPTLVAQKINNPFNILGVYIGFYLMKLGFGYAALLIPIILATIFAIRDSIIDSCFCSFGFCKQRKLFIRI